jgi:hypothetical protein
MPEVDRSLPRAVGERIIEDNYPTRDEDCAFALAFFEMVNHLGLDALSDKGVSFLARTILEERKAERIAKSLDAAIAAGPSAEVIQFPGGARA